MSLNALRQEVPSVQLADARRILLQARQQGVKDGKGAKDGKYTGRWQVTLYIGKERSQMLATKG